MTTARPQRVASPPTTAAPPADDRAPEEVDEFVEELPAAPVVHRRKQKLVLIGAGHAHLQLLEWWRDQPLRNVELTLISAFPEAVYSGMAPAVLAGLIPEAEMRIDLARLARRCGAQLVIDKVIGLDPETRTVDLAVHPEQTFDAASINIGSANIREDLCQTHRLLVAVKPLATFLSRWDNRLQELLAQRRDSADRTALQLAVVGGGAAGVELALCLERRMRREPFPFQIQLIDAGEEILPGFAPRAVRLTRKLFRRRAILLRLGAAVVACDEDGPAELVLEGGDRIRIDLAIWAAGAAPPGLLHGYQLPKTERGYLAVEPTLQTTADLPVFATGDVAEIVEHPCPKAGVFAVRQAPVLWHNLRQWFQQGELDEYDPQPHWLSLLCCGDGTALLNYRNWSLRSAWMWRLKQHLDKKFVDRFR